MRCILNVVVRIQVLVTEEERQRLRGIAGREGLSLSAWLRRLGLERAEAMAGVERLETAAELDRFFRACDRREAVASREPDWDEHLRVINASRSSGVSGT
jgi:hypothetical protein